MDALRAVAIRQSASRESRRGGRIGGAPRKPAGRVRGSRIEREHAPLEVVFEHPGRRILESVAAPGPLSGTLRFVLENAVVLWG